MISRTVIYRKRVEEHEKMKTASIEKWGVVRISLLSIGGALLLDLICYLISKQSDLFKLIFGR